MSRTFPAVLFTLIICGSALGQEGCTNCFQLNAGTMIGIVICDSIITLVIAGIAFWISTKIQKKKYQEQLKKLKNISPTTEATYEELHGHKLDVYNDLNSLRH